MASTQEYRDYILDQLTGLEGISCRAMMGEYLLYCQGKLVGGIYDNRLLVKPTASAVRLLPDAPRELPYEGAKEMLLVRDPENRELLTELIQALYEELPASKPKRAKKARRF